MWFPSDPAQTPAERFLSEVSSAGYEWIEIGPYGYLPTDPAEFLEQMERFGLRVSAGTVFEHLHREDSWEDVWKQISDVAALTRAVGGEHIIVIPEPWRDHRTGAALESPELSAAQWAALTGGMDELGRRVLEEYGLAVQFHSHADSHVGYQRDIERFLADTDPRYVNLCLDTGHVSYYRGDNLELIRTYPERIGYLHLKQVDPAVLDQVEAEDLTFPEAVRRGVMIEPPLGVPEMGPLLDAVAALDRDIYAIVEQDLYPCAPDVPAPIARRTHTYLAGCGTAALEIGTPRGTV
ncbi:sugar phosphate isomerase/epimerase [Pseudonocardia ailaonensis]|uniref:Sugar phosphate isomerase/epimerase n=1 Tax=Pseudonocardia ailaonensis TaxID=367279 RepID=A0ABN2NHE3_9PSEU